MTDNNTGITVTLKAGVGYEAPWIVVHAADVPDALSQIDTGDFGRLAERTVAAAEFFRAAHNVKKGLASNEEQAPPAPAPQQWNNQGAAPSWSNQGSQAAPAPAAQPAGKNCVHGPMTFREGISKKTNKAYKAYFCPTPQGTPNQCQAEFV